MLTYDILHSPSSEDLLDVSVQQHIAAMVDAGCFLSAQAQAGPVCSSFSRAVRPAVRSAEKPEGIDVMTEAMAKKVAIGNAMAQWLAELVRKFCLAGLPIENPAGSFLWLQPAWVALQAEFGLQSFLIDYCRWGTAWRKRAKFLGRFQKAGVRLLCLCKSRHVRLVGYRCCWTKAAEAYRVHLLDI